MIEKLYFEKINIFEENLFKIFLEHYFSFMSLICVWDEFEMLRIKHESVSQFEKFCHLNSFSLDKLGFIRQIIL